MPRPRIKKLVPANRSPGLPWLISRRIGRDAGVCPISEVHVRKKIGVMAGALFMIAFCCEARDLEVRIDYGKGRAPRTVTVAVGEHDTALTALMKAADVATRPVGEYVFVVAIDKVEGKRGEMAWYYALDGRPAKTLAFRQTLDDDVKSMVWTYVRDVCSREVDAPDRH
jgi:hypothetical protein